MTDELDYVKSFIKHMLRQGNEEGLRSYANLIYSGLVLMPAARSRHDEVKKELKPYASRCMVCNAYLRPLGSGRQCCDELYYEVLIRTMKALDKHRHDTFYHLDEGLVYRHRTYTGKHIH